MAASAGWDTPDKRAIRLDIHGHWAWDEVWDAIDQLHARLRRHRSPALILNIDSIAWRAFPVLDLVPNLRTFAAQIPSQLRPIVGVTDYQDSFVQTMVKTVRPALHSIDRVVWVSTLSEARHIVSGQIALPRARTDRLYAEISAD